VDWNCCEWPEEKGEFEMTNTLDGMAVHHSHALVVFPNENYHGPIWRKGDSNFVLYQNKLHEVKWVQTAGCWVRVAT